MSVSGCSTLWVPLIWGAEGNREELQTPCTLAPCSGYHPASHRSIPVAPHPQVTPPVLHQGNKSRPTAGVFRPLCLSEALLCPCQHMPSPTAHPVAPCPQAGLAPCPQAGSALVFPPWVGDSTKSGSTWGAAEPDPATPFPPMAGGEPQPGSCPGLETGWKWEPKKSPVKAVFEFLAWQQLL